MKRILIADDHEIVRFGLTMMLRESFPDYVIDESWDMESVMTLMKDNPYALVLLDIVMPNTDPTVLLHHIKNFHTQTKVLVLSMNEDMLYGARSIQQGAHGYLKKDAPKGEIVRAIHMILAGRKYLSPDVADTLLQNAIAGKPVSPFERLSAREFQIAMYLVQDYTQSQISEMLQVQYGTVNTFKQRLYQKLNIEHHKELTELASIYGLR
jgi:DNA-binding NarL/FixJ family response regulator